ncbi:MAG: DUF5320 domain-containing protein [Bacteroidetes bacterium]|nr:DUF5320 domain-containing protein [Bacteroidota bacterium]
MRNILFLFIIIITSCNSNKEEIELLKSENQALSNELSDLKAEIDSLKFYVFVIAEKHTIEIDEEYKAIAGIAIEKTSSPITSALLDIENPSNALYHDLSTKFETRTPGQILITAKKKIPGTYSIVGQLNMNLLGRDIERLFSIDYEVKK